MIVVAHVFSRPLVCLCHVRGDVVRSRTLFSSPLGRLSSSSYQRHLLCTSSVRIHVSQGAAVPRMARNLYGSLVECGKCCHCQGPPTSLRRLLVQTMSRNGGIKSRAPVRVERNFTSRPKRGVQPRECGTGTIYPASDLLNALVVCDEHLISNLRRFSQYLIFPGSCIYITHHILYTLEQ